MVSAAAFAWTTRPLAGISTAQHLPPAACNGGAMNAHAYIPAVTGSGKTTPVHMAVAGTANVTACGHGG